MVTAWPTVVPISAAIRFSAPWVAVSMRTLVVCMQTSIRRCRDDDGATGRRPRALDRPTVIVPESGTGRRERSSSRGPARRAAARSVVRLVLMPTLVVIVGPIASGKSTIAAALGKRRRAAGRPTAVSDLDDLVDTIGGFVGLPADRFLLAQHVFGQLVGAWLTHGIDVIAHGPFLAPEEDAALLQHIPTGVAPRRVLLRTTLATALERVRADPERLLSRHPDILAAAYERFEQLLPTMPPCDWTFDTTTTDAPTIVDELTAGLPA